MSKFKVDDRIYHYGDPNILGTIVDINTQIELIRYFINWDDGKLCGLYMSKHIRLLIKPWEIWKKLISELDS